MYPAAPSRLSTYSAFFRNVSLLGKLFHSGEGNELIRSRFGRIIYGTPLAVRVRLLRVLRVVGNASPRCTRAWDVHVEIDAGVFLCAAVCARGARSLVRQNETDRQPVYDIQCGHARTRPPHGPRHVRGVRELPLERHGDRCWESYTRKLDRDIKTLYARTISRLARP